MGFFSLNTRLAIGAVLLLSTKASSSYVPIALVPRTKINTVTSNGSCLTMRGGSDESNIEPSEPPTSQQIPLPGSPGPEVIPVEVPAPVTTESAYKLGPNAPPPGFLRKTFPNLPWHRLPNILTYIRCMAIPALIVMFYQPNSHVAVGTLFAFASFTDWLDGYLARRWDISSAFGAFLDPVADKLMVSTSLILLAGRYGAKVAIPTAIILAREIGVSALREWMAQRGQRDVVKVGFQGKVKTALTMVALTILLFVPTSEGAFLSKLYAPGLALLYLCSLVTVTSGSVYFIAAAPLLMEETI